MAMVPPQPDGPMDVCFWSASEYGSFTISSAYKVMRGVPSLPQEGHWKLVWRLKVP